MKRWSLKVKLTVLYTFFMTLVTCFALGVLFSLSSQELLSSVQSDLRQQVEESLGDVEAEEGWLNVDNDFYDLEDSVYLSLYSEQGEFLYGRLPYGYNAGAEFMNGQIQTIRDDQEEWYIYDVSHRIEGYGTVYFRGITSVTRAENSIAITIRLAVIILPLLVILTGIIGYRFTRRTLLPVQKITETVKKIRKDEDLSQRVGLGNGKDEIYQLSETFDQMLEELEETFKREQQFTSDVSHELRTPVTVILAQCEAMLQDPVFTSGQKEQVKVIEQKARSMARMISQLLLLSRADQGRQQVQKERLNLSELTQMIAEEQEILAREKEIQVLAEIQPDIYAQADESLYIRMLDNLISNAVNYGKKGGYVKVLLSEEENMVKGVVEDNGKGIPQESLPRIWERFYRVDTSRTDQEHSGLGLSMVKWIVQAHGGEITVESQEGQGSRFIFQIPED